MLSITQSWFRILQILLKLRWKALKILEILKFGNRISTSLRWARGTCEIHEVWLVSLFLCKIGIRSITRCKLLITYIQFSSVLYSELTM